MQELKALISSLTHTPQIIVITEVNTKTNNKSVSSEFNIPGYELYNANLEENCRGILIYVDNNLQSSIEIIESDFEEFLVVSIKGDDFDNLVIGTVYRSPKSKIKMTVYWLHLSILCVINLPVIFCL